MARLGAYEIDRPLSSGGMSDALLARSPAGRLVVLKKPRSNDKELAARLRDEARLGSRIFHPNLVETLDAFEENGLPVIVLGYVEGPTLDDLRRRAPLGPAAVARVGCRIAEALGAIHGAIGDDGTPIKGLHRDVSGRNIICTKDGQSVLIDLGIARYDEERNARTQTGMVLGTLRYMAPELIDGYPASAASDFYSLGCVLIEAATGEACFAGPPSALAGAIMTKGPLAGPATQKIEPRLRGLLAKITARKPEERFLEAHDLSSALRDLEAALGGGAPELGARVAKALTEPPPEHSNPGMFVPGPAGPSGTGPTSPAAVAGSPGRPTSSSMVVSAEHDTEPEHSVPLPPPILPALGPVTAAPASSSAYTPYVPPPGAAPLSRNPNALLELAIDPKRKGPQVQTHQDPRDWYPKKKKDPSAIAGALTKGIAIAAVIGGLLLGYRWYDEQQRNEDRAAIERKAAEEAELLRKALSESGPDCGGRGAMWVYRDKRGNPVVVDAIGKVPKQYRDSARCATPTR